MKSLPQQFIQFLSVGASGLLVMLAITYTLTEFLGFWYFFAYLIAIPASWTFMFFTNSLLTFKGHEKKKYGKKYAQFIAVYFVTVVINAVLVYSFTQVLAIHYLVSIVVATACTTIINFVFSKFVIFTYATDTDNYA